MSYFPEGALWRSCPYYNFSKCWNPIGEGWVVKFLSLLWSSHSQLSAELHFFIRFVSTEPSNHYKLKGSDPVLLNFSLAVLIAAELLSATKWHWNNVRIWFTCRKTKKLVVWSEMLFSICPAPEIPSHASFHRRWLRMGLGLALFVFFYSSVFFAVRVHSVVQNFSCMKLTDVNPYVFYSCDNLWLIIDILAGNKHVVCFLAGLMLINPVHFCLRHMLLRRASSTANFSHPLAGALVRSLRETKPVMHKGKTALGGGRSWMWGMLDALMSPYICHGPAEWQSQCYSRGNVRTGKGEVWTCHPKDGMDKWAVWWHGS